MSDLPSMSTASIPIRLLLSSDTVASYPSCPNSFIPLLNQYCGVERRPCKPLMLLYIVIVINIYITLS